MNFQVRRRIIIPFVKAESVQLHCSVHLLAGLFFPGRDVKIVSQMPTMNGVATVVDSKTLQREGNILVLVQTLVVRNEMLGKEHTTVRYFMPHQGEVGQPAVTAKGNLKE